MIARCSFCHPTHLILPSTRRVPLPALISAVGPHAIQRLVQFFTAEIRNPNTRAAYARAIDRFDRWGSANHAPLADLTPVHVAAYIEHLGRELSKPSVKQHLAALRMLFDYLVTGIVPFNPVSPVRGPKYVLKSGKTPVMNRDEVRQLFAALAGPMIADLRDRALIGVLVYSFARVSAVLHMDVGDYYQQGERWWVRLHEKGGKDHAVPVHHTAEEYLDAYLAAAGSVTRGDTPLFRTLDRHRRLSADRLDRHEALAMVKRRCRQAGLGDRFGCHTFRATGITAYLGNGGTVEKAQAIAAHESPRTTKLYDRTCDAISLDEIERIVF
ncbi:integrase : Site-specific recombinase XerD OS=Singulisphaera acidiphila (strain ATCC BAA-1392 / DSM 18658 / VKM B-2454 / MOB10) GN=Sinac_7582 PE=4 SV=1: Phage_int_SAM_1: Phage_integrase [Gemmata massiliana]|uniref:Tyr recombinase domain-containing protein n=1 Tax=Gemmata massiliana TaxID=1210884 RepID=A0A6P2CYI7_9BACT|nr:tyrosine-type recombinase/integrase [Gemmata massiliana]VTR94188.1 integrase : Site-specific recombinase XerD OS=Singulisphaera acidiphila (strain ATCC BAA-1392 / DSM 18658 / VKM B-2454 / MOB10) GN=Sinac_7582 PE=4 SV=1: Phage_int_SAM_1: Phage_integrase [Gemmata massiliana]